jgi:hypothetical protein
MPARHIPHAAPHQLGREYLIMQTWKQTWTTILTGQIGTAYGLTYLEVVNAPWMLLVQGRDPDAISAAAAATVTMPNLSTPKLQVQAPTRTPSSSIPRDHLHPDP